MFQFHQEHSIFVGRLESCDILLANMHRRGSRVLEEHDTREGKSVGDVS
jgi:hypothetical protein